MFCRLYSGPHFIKGQRSILYENISGVGLGPALNYHSSMRLAFAFIIAVLALPNPAHAQGAPSEGMHTLEMTSDRTAEMLLQRHQDQTGQKPTVNAPSLNAPSAPIPDDANLGVKTLTLIPDPAPAVAPASAPAANEKNEKATGSKPDIMLTPRADLRAWPVASQFSAAQTPEDVNVALAAFEAAPGRANPQDILEVAMLYAMNKDMDRAARYYYGAQLRQAFDARRFPQKKSPTLQGTSLAGLVGSWAVSSSDRLFQVINDVEKWDQQIPYDYRPLGVLPDPDVVDNLPAEKDWPDILAQTRRAYFTDLREVATALRRMGK